MLLLWLVVSAMSQVPPTNVKTTSDDLRPLAVASDTKETIIDVAHPADKRKSVGGMILVLLLCAVRKVFPLLR